MWRALALLCVAISSAPVAASTAPWRCEGALVPPAGYEQEVAFSTAGREAAVGAARQGLTARICQGAPCAELASRVAVWLTGEGGGQHCAMAVVERTLVEEWRAGQSARSLHLTLQKGLAEALGPDPARAKAGRPRVALGRVGGAAAAEPVGSFVRGQLQQALSGLAGVEVMKAPAPGVVVVDADVVERLEQQRAILDITVTLAGADGRLKTVGAVVPRAILPVGVESSTTTLSLQVEARCERREGERFVPVGDCAQTPLSAGDRLKLVVTPSATSFVYVMAWNSLGQLQLLYPLPDQPNELSGRLELPDGDWLVLDEVKNVTEHIVVVAALKRQPHLELLRGVDVPPRRGEVDADALVSTRTLLGEIRARGFKMPAGRPAAAAAPASGAVPVVERGPGIAAVELAIAHR